MVDTMWSKRLAAVLERYLGNDWCESLLEPEYAGLADAHCAGNWVPADDQDGWGALSAGLDLGFRAGKDGLKIYVVDGHRYTGGTCQFLFLGKSVKAVIDRIRAAAKKHEETHD